MIANQAKPWSAHTQRLLGAAEPTFDVMPR